MLVHLLVLLHVADLCHGKSLNYRGKRSYHGQMSEPPAQSDYYYPQIDGQPIYVPSIGHSASDMNQLLEDYYRRYPTYTQAWAHPTSVPYNYDNGEGNYYESPVTSNSMVTNFLRDTDDDGHRGGYHILPTKSQMKYEPQASIQPQFGYNEHSQETHEKNYRNREDTTPDENTSPKNVEKVNVKKGNKIQKTKPELDDYNEPLVYEKVKVENQGNKDIPKMDNKLGNEEYEQLVVHEKTNKKKGADKSIHKTKLKLEKDSDYEEPVVLDRVKIKKHDPYASKTDSELEKVDDDYEEPIVRERVNIKKHNKKSYASKVESKLEKGDEDYEEPIVRERVNIKKHDKKPYTSKMESKLEKGDEDYEEPIIRDKISKKKYEDERSYTTVTESELEDDYKNEKPAVKENLKQEKIVADENKKQTKTPSKSNVKVYSKKSNKGKRKQQWNIKKRETSGEYSVTPGAEKENLKEVNEKIESYENELQENIEPLTKSDSKKTSAKTKNKATVKTKQKVVPVKNKDKVKPEPTENPVKNKDKVSIKTKENNVKTKDKVVVKSKPKVKPIKSEDKVEEVDLESDDEYETEDPDYSVKEKNEDISDDTELPLGTEVSRVSYPINEIVEDSEKISSENDFENADSEIDRPLKEEEKTLAEVETESGKQVVGGNSMNTPKLFHNDAVRSLSSLNANIWSLIFNPNAVGLALKKCLTRTNETGYCTYVQNCEVPDIATSLEQLLNNACVIDDVFIGVCCPEFPVQTVKVHWEDEIESSGKQSESSRAEFDEDDVDDCGIRSNEATKQQSWPWKAPLVSMSNGRIFCGGVIISENYVLTAAHCTTKIPKNQILVRLGQFDDSTGDDYAVVEIKRHAQYNPRTMQNDIALLKLGRRIDKNEHTGIICLPDDDDDEDEHDGEKAILLGWKGMFGKDSKTEFLEIMEKDECKNKLRMNVPKTMLCTEARNEDERTCNADSGAPLVIEDDDKYEVIGILSWNRNDCDQRFPSTFSRVSRYVGWIRKHAV